MEPSKDSRPTQEQQRPPQPARNHLRSRLTVVCTECKRLKLRCDRRGPCGACVKRYAVDRCWYSWAMTEKIGLRSFQNLVVTFEAQMAAFNSVAATQKPTILPIDHTLLTIGNSGSSPTVPLDGVVSIWLSQGGMIMTDPELSTTTISTRDEMTYDGFTLTLKL